ncbi:hypothetical protein JHN63_18010 [Streptomyces sp. MBT65]|uniref:hypothetical protein n=1 Tax=Streptomyces sp. MBT65 TaxID=1488395 RepID=UPI00190A40CB|nr:hypothetical protein [Streptomyces sp. MBT65]MBK3575675.1 hypothetical protein [Streptomyces sp. MBT65]
MNREREVVKAFVELADTYAPDFDPLHLFDRLVQSCRQLLDVDAVAVMIADARGTLKTMAATDDEAAFIELMQMQTGRGPCTPCRYVCTNAPWVRSPSSTPAPENCPATTCPSPRH